MSVIAPTQPDGPTITMAAPTAAPAASPAPVPDLFAASVADRRDFATELRHQTMACRVMHTKLGVRKALSQDQLREAASQFHADVKVLSAKKKLIDTRDPAYRRVIEVRRRAGAYWKSHTTPYPEPGVRLIRRQIVAVFTEEMTKLRDELLEAARQLQEKYAELRERARVQLGDLFNPEDYPTRIDDEFDLDWDFPSVEPPAYLRNLHPQLYERESQRIKARFDEAIRLTDEAFASQFQQLIVHLADRLAGDTDGKPKVFRDTAVKNLTSFFETFRALDPGSNSQLQQLVTQAQQVVAGITPGDLRDSADLRTRIAAGLAPIRTAVDAMMINRPTRAIEIEREEAAEETAEPGEEQGSDDARDPEGQGNLATAQDNGTGR